MEFNACGSRDALRPVSIKADSSDWFVRLSVNCKKTDFLLFVQLLARQ